MIRLLLVLLLSGCASMDVSYHFGASTTQIFDLSTFGRRDLAPEPPAMPGGEDEDDD